MTNLVTDVAETVTERPDGPAVVYEDATLSYADLRGKIGAFAAGLRDYNVYPREIEELLFEHDAVADVAVVGVPDERRRETVKAFVVPVPDADVTPEAIKEYCLRNLAEYKHPREVAFVEELPRTTGKVQKFELREAEAQ